MEDESVTHVDWSVARNLTGGDADLLQELIDLFPAETEKHLSAVRQAVERRDDAALTLAAHTLKSSARLFGAAALAARALQIENLGRSSDLDGAARHVPALEEEIRRVIAALERGPAS
jgi:HPt (histidine-containing phosphotransfer) domain-containing protein